MNMIECESRIFRNDISLNNGRFIISNGFCSNILPTTTVVTNIPAPYNCPMTRFGLAFVMPIIDENISGAPLPNARNVTP
ncbi:hypothetical protein BLA29_007106 [Euroglyphus maynei]|uniref:Uncharacterized protein n=1 Tax=Euroglyphus maynei TaxID=6958 RepID=A0A1Y3BG72_EURMA|nr:hypothetical protein BLA29_007106 [Euroglyphus maynei]